MAEQRFDPPVRLYITLRGGVPTRTHTSVEEISEQVGEHTSFLFIDKKVEFGRKTTHVYNMANVVGYSIYSDVPERGEDDGTDTSDPSVSDAG